MDVFPEPLLKGRNHFRRKIEIDIFFARRANNEVDTIRLEPQLSVDTKSEIATSRR